MERAERNKKLQRVTIKAAYLHWQSLPLNLLRLCKVILAHDIQHNDTLHNDTLHNDIQPNAIQPNEIQPNATHHNDIQHNNT